MSQSEIGHQWGLYIDENFFTKLENLDFFKKTFYDSFNYFLSRHARLNVEFSESRLEDAHQSWCRDSKHLVNSLPEGNEYPDHFKKAGMLAYWLRRSNPVNAYLTSTDDINCRSSEMKIRNFIFEYGDVFLAFDFGLTICKFFEEEKVERNYREPRITENYYRTVCYFLKYKNVSPHALTLIYASLFR